MLIFNAPFVKLLKMVVGKRLCPISTTTTHLLESDN
jgi:hypothetical protein